MGNNEGISEIDKLLVFHQPLIKGTGICGLAGDYHEPRKGTTFMLSKDRNFTVEWHEGAHSFLTQRTPLGLILTTLTTSLHMILKEAFHTKHDLEKKIKFIDALIKIREVFLQSVLIPHEIFAIYTERRERLGDKFYTSRLWIDKIYEKESKRLASLDAEKIKFGFEQHELAFKYIQRFEKEYGHLWYAGDAIETILTFLPLIITNISPWDLLFGPFETSWKGTPTCRATLERMLEKKPKWAPDSSISRMPDFLEMVMKYINIRSEYGDIMKNMKLIAEWMREFMYILPLSEEFKRHLKFLLLLNAEILHFQKIPKKSKLKGRQESLDTEEFPWNFLKKMKTMWSKERIGELIKGSQIAGNIHESLLGLDPIETPPPVVLESEGEELVLKIRSDIFRPNGLNHLLNIFTEIALTDMYASPGELLVKQILSYPIVCFSDYCEVKIYECENGFGSCLLPLKIWNIVSMIRERDGVEVDPFLICCKEGVARFSPVSFLKKGSTAKPGICPFRIEKIDLQQ